MLENQELNLNHRQFESVCDLNKSPIPCSNKPMSIEITPTVLPAPPLFAGRQAPKPHSFEASVPLLSQQPVLAEQLAIETGSLGRASEPLPLVGATEPPSLRQSLTALIAERMHAQDPPWYSEEGACMDFAALWYQDLKAKGWPVSLAITDTKGPQGKTLLDSQQEIAVDKVHAFIVVHTPEGELILDPTWKQFTADKKAVTHLPSIAFGSLAELKSLYAQAKSELQLETHGHDPLQGRYQTEKTVDLLYSAGAQQAHRQLLNE